MSYWSKIQEQRKENRAVLHQLLQDIPKDEYVFKTVSISEDKPKPPKRRKTVQPEIVEPRRSTRLSGKENGGLVSLNDVDSILSTPKVKNVRPNVYGVIPDVPVGTTFDSREEASLAGIHRPYVAGIHGDPTNGCYSIALSGGYPEDKDNGTEFVFTGEGGRDLKGSKTNPKNLRTAPQSKDQSLTRGNLALIQNIEKNVPIRVLRGFKLQSCYAPEKGYRYDGLYNVVRYSFETGSTGFKVYKFFCERVKNQDSAPWESSEKSDDMPKLKDHGETIEE